MKKSSLSGALAAAIVGTVGLASLANAQVNRAYLNADGLGQVLIYPYYTVNKNQSTLISVVNTTDQVKAVKVRFLEGRNSQEVLDFNLYLSPFDVWTAGLNDQGNAEGPAIIATSDTSCTVPAIPAAGEPFRNFQYAANNKDDGPYGLDRTREGHLEIIEMGVVVDNGDTDDLYTEELANGDAHPRALASAATHLSTGIPEDCAALRSAWRISPAGVWTTARNTDMLPPSGGLFGGTSIVDVALGTNLSYNADAIDGFYTIQDQAGAPYPGAQGPVRVDSNNTASIQWNTLHRDPGNLFPNLGDARNQPDGSSTVALFTGGTEVQMNFATGRGPAAVSALFMQDAIYNEFVTQESLGATSEWVVTFPTKRLHIDQGRDSVFVPGSQASDENHELLQRLRPFTDWVDATENGFVYDTNGSCERIARQYHDREEGPYDAPSEADAGFSPPPPGQGPSAPLSLCYEAQVISFNQPTTGEGDTNTPSKVLGSRYARNLNLAGAANGWVRIDLGVDALADPFNLGNSRGNYLLDGAILSNLNDTKSGIRLFGLPVTGFWALQVARTDGGSALANYSGVWRHRGSREFGLYSETILQDGFVPGCTRTVLQSGSFVTLPCENIVTDVATSSGSAL